MTPSDNDSGVKDGTGLARRIRVGDRAAESELVAHYCDCIFAMALARTHDRDAASELMDEVLMTVIVALRRNGVRDPARLSGFVRGTAVNIINGYLRSSRRVPRSVALRENLAGDDPADDFEELDRRAVADRALRLLNERDRRILELSLVDGLKPGEIAASLGISPVVVRQRKCRALRAIFLYLNEDSRGYAARRLLRT